MPSGAHIFEMEMATLEEVKAAENSMKRRSKGASPNGGFLYFWPVEFLEQISYSSLELRSGVFRKRR
jgi:hypothetical protein